ncbi:MAG TPA: hypothetical protein PK228_16915 [Saprospiraceae bacterium]|nr:hypothetical protein [Saprospiraceae bacterium]
MKTDASDQFERYYAEKLWEMIPAIYRHEDGLAENPGVLRALVEVLAGQAAILRRSQDRLWEDQFIEWCNDWAVPYIADLVGTRMISALNKRGRRVDVAKTIYYRRRKGTPRILEELISDISGWEGKLVESFQRLARTRHGLDPQPAALAGRFSGTMPGGWADLRQPRSSQLAGGPFDEYFHTADFRRHEGRDGRYNIPKLAFHLYRLVSWKVVDSTPFSMNDGLSFLFDPSGRDIPLFNRRNRPDDWEEWHSALEWELPAPMRCRLLGHGEYRVTEAVIQELTNNGLSGASANALRQLHGEVIRHESRLNTTLNAFGGAVATELTGLQIYVLLLQHALVEQCGKHALLPDGLAIPDPDTGSLAVRIVTGTVTNTLTAEVIAAGNLALWNFGQVLHKKMIVDPENGRFMFKNGSGPGSSDKLEVRYHYGFSAEIGAGTYERKAVKNSGIPPTVILGGGILNAANVVTQIGDSKTYGPLINKVSINQLTLQSANHQRPYLRLANTWLLRAAINAPNARLTLDGLWIGSAGNGVFAITLLGDFERVTIRNCTLDPGGDKNARGEILHPLQLIVRGNIQELIIEDSIVGPISTRLNGLVENLYICDSIVQSVDSAIHAISLAKGIVTLQRSTVFGKTQAHRLQASEVIMTDIANINDTQSGCFRFSAAPATSRVPRPYESFLFSTDTHHWFTSRRFGDPGYAQLSDTAPAALQRGAENGSEMGAFSSLLNPIKFDGLKTKIEEYMPFGLIPIFINET